MNLTNSAAQARDEAERGIPGRKVPDRRKHLDAVATIAALAALVRTCGLAALDSMTGVLDQNPMADLNECRRVAGQVALKCEKLVDDLKASGGWEAEYAKLNAERAAARAAYLESRKPVPTAKLIDKAAKAAKNKNA